eukprot:gene4673-4927_t
MCSSNTVVFSQLSIRDVAMPSFPGAILCFSGSSNVILEGAAVSNNVAGQFGAVQFNQQGSATLKECTFSNNTAVSDDVAKGGALSLLDSAAVSIQSSLFTNNTVIGGVYGRGGAVFVSGAASLNVSSSTFSGNMATFLPAHGASTSGGAIFAESQSAVSIKDASFIENFAAGPVTGAGGALALANQSAAVIQNSTFHGNFIGGYAAFGGAINAKANATARISSCLLSNNLANSSEVTSFLPGEASVWGRAVGGSVLVTDNVMLYVEDSIFRNNTSVRQLWGTASGGAITASKSAQVTITRSSFKNNTVLGDYGMGGGALTMSKRTVVVITDSNFTDNRAHCSIRATGGALHVGDSGQLTVINCLLLNNRADSPSVSGGSDGTGGAIGVIMNGTAKVHNSTIINNTASGYRSSGGGLYADGTSSFQVFNTRLVGNSAAQGGAMGSVQGQSWIIDRCYIGDHTVQSLGGGIMVAGSSTMSIRDTVIVNNRGTEGGGVYAHTFDSPFFITMVNTTLSQNFAVTGGACLFRGGEVQLGAGVVISRNTASQEAGGLGWFSGCLGSGLCPSKVKVSCDAVIENNTASVAGGGVFIGQNAHLAGADLQEGQCQKRIVRNNQAAFGDADVFYVRKVCQTGEVSRGGWCDQCPANMYSFTADADRCEVCPPVGAICPGGSVLLPERGYWHSHPYSTQMHRCPNNLACQPSSETHHHHRYGCDAAPAAAAASEPPKGGSMASSSRSKAVGSWNTSSDIRGRRLQADEGAPLAAGSSDVGDAGNMDWQCAEGYRGNVCGSCKDGYGMRSVFVCGECMPVGRTVLLFLVALFCVILLLSYMAHATWLDNRVQHAELRVSDVLKVLVLFVQYLAILGSARVSWPHTMNFVFVAVSYLLSSCTSQVISLDCIFPRHLSMPAGIARGLVYLLLPLVVAMAVTVVFILAWCRRALYQALHKRACMKLGPWLAVRLPVILLVVFYFFYPSLVHTAWSAFACFPIDVAPSGPYAAYAVANATGGYWVGSMDTVCWAGYHKVWALAVCLPFVLLFCVVVPAAIYLTLHLYNTNAFSSSSFQQNFGFLFRNFKPKRFYWEAVVAVQTVVLVCIYVFGHVVGVYYQMVMFTVVFVCSLVIHLLFKPFAFDQLQHIQLMSSGCLCFTSFVALTMFEVNGQEGSAHYREVAGALVLALNAAFLAYCVFCVGKLAVAGLRQTIQESSKKRRARTRYADSERAQYQGPLDGSSTDSAQITAVHALGSSSSTGSTSTACAVQIWSQTTQQHARKDVEAHMQGDKDVEVELQPSMMSNDSIFAAAVPQAAAAAGAPAPGLLPPGRGMQLPGWWRRVMRR